MPAPESTSSIIRRALTDRERNVLVLAGKDGPYGVFRDLSGVKSEDEARRLIEEVGAKVRRVIAETREAEARAGRGAAARSSSNGNGNRSQTRAALDAAGVPAETPGTIHEEAAGVGGSPEGDPPPPAPAATSSFDVPEPEPARADPPTMPRREPGELRRMVLDIIERDGPIRQADVRARVGIASPQMAGLVRQLEPLLVVGEPVGRSPMLSMRQPAPAEPDVPALDHPPAPPEVPSGVVGEDEKPEREERSARELFFEYMDALFVQARTSGCPEHVFDRIEKQMREGPPA